MKIIRFLKSRAVHNTYILLLVGLFHLHAFRPVGIAFPIAFFVYLIFATLARHWQGVHFGLLFTLVGLNFRYLPEYLLMTPVLPLLIPLGIATLLILPFREVKETLSWMRRGTIDRASMLLMTPVGLISAAALILWASVSENLGIGAEMIGQFEKIPFWLIIAAGVPLFAIFNAATEEAIFRGVVQEMLDWSFDTDWIVWLFQAMSFAALHYATGFPNGVVGYGMVLVYGFALGYLRTRTGGILIPIMTHIMADLVTGYYLVFTMLN